MAAVLLILSCSIPTPLPLALPTPSPTFTPLPGPTSAITVTPTASPTPTETEVPQTETPAPADTPIPQAPNKFTEAMVDSLILKEADVAGFKLSRQIDFGPQDGQGLKEWFGSAASADPFITAGLLRIGMGAFDTGAKCTKVCWIISSAMIYSSTNAASQAPLLLLNYEKSHDKTLTQLTADQIVGLTQKSNISSTLTFIGTTGTIGIGKFAAKTISFYAPVSNGVVVLQAGGAPGVPDSITPADVYPTWHITYDRAIAK